jgi:hypothetical protein
LGIFLTIRLLSHQLGIEDNLFKRRKKMPTDSALQALAILRDGSQFQWYVIPLFAFVVYVYAVEVERRNWNLVFAGLAFWGMDWFNEIWNALVFHFTNYAPVWGTPGKTAYLILIGLNIADSVSLILVIFPVGLARLHREGRVHIY